MITMEDEVINVFYEVDEILKDMGHKSHHHAKLEDSEVIAIGLMKELWHLKTDSALWRLFRDQYGSFFPSVMFIQPFSETSEMVGATDETHE